MKLEPSIEQTLRDLEERLAHHVQHGSPQEVETLLDEAFVEFGKSGRIYARHDVLAALHSEAPPPAASSFRAIADFSARLLGPGVVLVTYRVTEERSPGQPSMTSLRSSLWRLREGRWQIVFHQGTLC